jgi:predicted nuclease of predicted toxin-antitoxin system
LKIWLDAQLSPSLAVWLSRRFKLEATAIRDVGLRNAADREIFDAARKADVVVVTKDRDFVDLLEKYGPPPKVLWVTCGNTSNARMRSVLAKEFASALEILNGGEALVELTDLREA